MQVKTGVGGGKGGAGGMLLLRGEGGCREGGVVLDWLGGYIGT